MTGAVIRTTGLTKLYGDTVGIEDLDLAVEPGTVVGYLGPNGSGKTTTLRLLAGLLRPTAGRAEVLGRDCFLDRDAVHARIGYLPGDFSAYPDLTGAEYLTYLGNLRGGVDRTRRDGLADRFDLDLGRRVRALSRGNRQKLGLVQAFVHDPDVLLLDEPTSGLDPLMQREFLGLLRETRQAGRTVLLSSHVLSEVESIADVVAILRAGRLVVTESVSRLERRALRRIDLTFATTPPGAALRAADGVVEVREHDHTAAVVVEGSMEHLLAAAAPFGIQAVLSHEADLEQVFLDFYGRTEGGRDAVERVPQVAP